MKNYDFAKAYGFIEAEKEVLAEAILGMHEDWFWTAETIWENGKKIEIQRRERALLGVL